MVHYVAACRHHGRPLSGQQVLDALVTEYQVAEAIRVAEATGGALARLVDADGQLRALRPIVPAPQGRDVLRAWGRVLAAAPGADRRWQIWTGAAWSTLPPPLDRAGHTDPPRL